MAFKMDEKHSHDAEMKDPEAQGDTSRMTNKSDESSGNEELVTIEKGYERDELHGDLTPEEQHRALRKCDYRLIPLLGVLYLVAFIDRSNIGNAKIAGMEEDLNLQGMQYSKHLPGDIDCAEGRCDFETVSPWRRHSRDDCPERPQLLRNYKQPTSKECVSANI